jgi:hypothetical protein
VWQVSNIFEWVSCCKYDNHHFCRLNKNGIPAFVDWRTNSSKIQKAIIAYAIPKLTVDEEEMATEILCLHYYSTGNAFCRVEDSYLHDFC